MLIKKNATVTVYIPNKGYGINKKADIIIVSVAGPGGR